MTRSEDIWISYHARLLAFINTRVDTADSEDILHEVFIKVHERIDSLREAEKLESWLFQITRNSIIDYYRKKRPTDERPDWLSIETSTDNYADNIRQELSLCLLPMIDELPEKYRTAVYMSEIEGRPQSAVASQENISISGAKSRIQRGRQLLKAMLNRCCAIEINNKNQLVNYHPSNNRCKTC